MYEPDKRRLRTVALQGTLAGLAALATVLAGVALLPGPSTSAPADISGPTAEPAPAPPSAVLHPEIHSVGAATPVGRGWLILDPRGGRVHRLDARGRRIQSFGRPGRGPGELASPAGLLARGDTVLVAERTGGRVHRFTLSGRYLDSRPALPPGCLGGGLQQMASMGRVPLLLFRCLDPRRQGSYAAVYALEEPLRLLARRPLRGANAGTTNPFLMPALAAHAGGFFLGITTEPCLQAFDVRGEAGGRVCHPWASPVPLPARERARLEAARRRLGSGTGIRIRIPPTLPPFDRVFTSRGAPVFLTVTGVEGRALEVLEGDGLRRLPLPATPGTFVGDGSVLVTWQTLEGTRVGVYPLPG